MELSSLDLSGIVASPIITCTIEGVLEPNDLALQIEKRGQTRLAPSSGEQVERIKEKHHALARYIAGGLEQKTAARLVGYTPAYVSTLLDSPAMQELVGHYRARHENAHEAITEKLRTVGLGAIEKLEEKLEENALDANQLLGLAKLGLDRGGHGPTSTQKQQSETHFFDHAELARLQREARRGSKDYIEQLPRALPARDDN